MILTIKTTEENLPKINDIIERYNPIVYLDNSNDPLQGFKEMLDIDVVDYRLHFHDNVTISDNLDKYLPRLTKFLEKGNIDYFSLSAAPNKRLNAEYFVGKRVSEYRNDRYILHDCDGVIFSKKFINHMRKEIQTPNRLYFDELSFINFVLGKYGILGYVHLPTLVNSNTNPNSLFEKNYINSIIDTL